MHCEVSGHASRRSGTVAGFVGDGLAAGQKEGRGVGLRGTGEIGGVFQGLPKALGD